MSAKPKAVTGMSARRKKPAPATAGRQAAAATPGRKAAAARMTAKAVKSKPPAKAHPKRKGWTPRAPTPAEKERARLILERLQAAIPDWGPTLRFRNAFELLVATILAAQASDESVNRVTEGLFEKYEAPADFVKAKPAELQKDVHSLGFFRQKAKAVQLMSQGLLEKFGGDVPRDVEPLTELHGVGRKTASIVAGAAYGVPSIAVDRHVARVANRLGFTKQTDPDRIELDLRARFEEKDWIRATWLLVLHGRRTCQPTPKCPACVVRDLCPYPRKTTSL